MKFTEHLSAHITPEWRKQYINYEMAFYHDDECLPEISLNTSADDINFFMPDADRLATQRAQEAAIDEELRNLRQRAATDDSEIALHHRSDSNSSEGPEILVEPINPLQLVRAHSLTSAADIIEVIIPHCHGYAKDFLIEFVDCLKEADGKADIIVNSFLDTVSNLMQNNNDWSDNEVIGVCLTCISVSAQDTRTSQVNKVLLQMLENVATKEHITTMTTILVSSLPSMEESIRLRLVSRLRGVRSTQRAARVLGSAALRLLLNADQQQKEAGGLNARSALSLIAPVWRDLSPDKQYQVVLLLGRVLERQGLMPEEDKARKQLFSSITLNPVRNKNRPDRLKVAVAVSKLQLLFKRRR